MEKRLGVMLRLTVIACIAFVFYAAPVGAESTGVFELKMADSFPIGHLGNQAAEKMIQRAEELSGKKLKIEYYPAQQMGKLQDMLNLCRLGTVDITYIPPSFFSGQVPLNTVMILPFWTTSTEGTAIYQQLLEQAPELTEEFLKYNVRPIGVIATSQYDVGTVDQPIGSPEDLKGLRLKSSGGIFLSIAKQYGIQPVSISSPETYEAIRRGVVDGAIFAYSSVRGYRLDEVINHHTYGLRMGGFPSVYVINEDVWKGLPEDIRSAIQKAANESAIWLSENWDKQQKALADQFESAGMEIYRIPEGEKEKWFAPLAGIEKEWIENMEKRGLPGRKVFDAFYQISKAVSE
jgi:TRAP-type C4-dicarboxylate transport system substrate-binding protein